MLLVNVFLRNDDGSVTHITENNAFFEPTLLFHARLMLLVHGDGVDYREHAVTFFWQHRQCLTSARCSVTNILDGGMSKTCRDISSTDIDDSNDEPQSGQLIIACLTTASGVAVCFKVSPLCSSCPPFLCWPFARNEVVRGGLDSPSLDGGLELLRLFLFKRFSSSTIFTCSVLIISV